jgi:predicted dehydrogenase
VSVSVSASVAVSTSASVSALSPARPVEDGDARPRTFKPSGPAGTDVLTCACIGLGDLGRLELSILDSIDGVEVVAGADPSPAARRRTESEHGVETFADHETLLEVTAPDLVSIATPHTLHYGQARDALAAGTHVHLEKPMVTELADARDLIERADAAGLTLAVGYQRHFDPRVRELRRLLDEGRIGEPHMAVCHLEQHWIDWNRDRWRGDPSLSGGGQLYDSGSHLLDTLLWTTRSAPVAVVADVDRRDAAVDVNTALAVRLDRHGQHQRLTASVAVSGDGPSGPAPGESIRVIGTDGMVSYDGERIELVERGVTYEASPRDLGFEELTRRKFRNTVDAITGDATLEIPAEDALKVTALTEAAYEAAETGRRVAIDLDLDFRTERSQGPASDGSGDEPPAHDADGPTEDADDTPASVKDPSEGPDRRRDDR